MFSRVKSISTSALHVDVYMYRAYLSAGFLDLPFVRRWHRFWLHLAAHGETECGLRQEVQARVFHLPGTTSND